MSLSTKVILSFLAGLFSALLAWVVIDFNGYYRLSNASSGGAFTQMFSEQALVGAIFGILVGLSIGFINGLSAGSSRAIMRDICWGAAVGLGGGLVGLFFGQLFFGSLYIDPRRAMSIMAGPFAFIWNVIIRAVGWAFIGVFLGLAQGLPSGSGKAARHGAVGGFIGGLLGGTLFEITPYILPLNMRNPGVLSRGIGMTVTGASIGLFIGLVETLMKQAWVRVVQGHNEGREYIISKARTTIGRDELSDVGLFGDRSISPLHAVIELQSGRYMLQDAGSPAGTMLNGGRVAEHILRDGDMIGIGSMRLEFHEKATASKLPKPVDAASMPPMRIPVSDNICPFCGGTKDPSTGACACTLPGQPSGDVFSRPAPAPTGVVSAPAGTGPRIVGTNGLYAGQSFPLSALGVTGVGREPGRDIQLPMDTTISRKHAHIVNEGGAFIVYDEGSSNGTKVNGVHVTRQPLAPGDVIAFGTSEFRFEE